MKHPVIRLIVIGWIVFAVIGGIIAYNRPVHDTKTSTTTSFDGFMRDCQITYERTGLNPQQAYNYCFDTWAARQQRQP